MRTALSWTITQRVVVIPCRRFETSYRSHPWIVDPWRWDWYVVPKRRQRITTIRCVTAQKNAVLSKYVVQFQTNAFLKEIFFFYFLSCNLRVKTLLFLEGPIWAVFPTRKKERKVCELENKDFNMLSYYYVTITCCGSHPLSKSRWPCRGCYF
jgi:hypothetical protein